MVNAFEPKYIPEVSFKKKYNYIKTEININDQVIREDIEKAAECFIFELDTNDHCL